MFSSSERAQVLNGVLGRLVGCSGLLSRLVISFSCSKTCLFQVIIGIIWGNRTDSCFNIYHCIDIFTFFAMAVLRGTRREVRLPFHKTV